MTNTNIRPSTLRPGLLVSLKTSVTGNVSYTKRDIEAERETDNGALKAVWETERVISDPAEFEEAITVRSKVRSLITSVCSSSAFGLLCPDNRIEDLNKAIDDANAAKEAFNNKSSLTKVNFYIVAGKIAPDDARAIQAINSEVSDLMQTMEDGLKNLDAETVRKAAKKARDIGAMLAPEAAERIKDVIDTARKAARDIVKAAETGAAEIDLQAIKKLKEARTSFLDLDGETEVAEPMHGARAIDLMPEAHADGEAPAFADDIVRDSDGAPAMAPDEDVEPIAAPVPKIAQFELGE